MAEDSVLIAGGGIAGLALERALHQRGITATVAERRPTGAGGGLAIHLTGNAVAALGTLGLSEQIERLGRAVRRREYRTGPGELVFETDEEVFWAPASPPRVLRRSDLMAVLDLAPAGSRAAADVRAVQLTADGASVEFADGRAGEYDFVVGADGVHSVVRSGIFGADGRRTALLSAASWRSVAPNPGVDCFTVWSTAESAVLFIPLSDDEAYFYASAVTGGPVEPDPSWLTRAFSDFPRPVREVIDSLVADPSRLYHSPINEVRIPTWSRGRAVLIGDAAHATAPLWAEGSALALEDALVLADVLAEGDWDTAGERFEARRRPRVDHVAAMTDLASRGAAGSVEARRQMLPQGYVGTYGPLRTPIELSPLPALNG